MYEPGGIINGTLLLVLDHPSSVLVRVTLMGMDRRWTWVVTCNPGMAQMTLCTPSGTLHPLCCGRVRVGILLA